MVSFGIGKDLKEKGTYVSYSVSITNRIFDVRPHIRCMLTLFTVRAIFV